MKLLYFTCSVSSFLVAAAFLGGCDTDPEKDCTLIGTCCDDGTYDCFGGGGAGAGTTTSMGGTGPGGGGSDPCGGCDAPTPFCDEAAMQCVSCLDHGDCDGPAAAKCDAGSCVPCDASPQCGGIAGAEVCDAGTCVECALGDEDSCDAGSGETCNLVTNACVDVGPLSAQNCEPCTNDLQCATGHRCIPLDFEGSPHGHYCLREYPPACNQPFAVPMDGRASLSGAAPANYCGVNEDLATCETVIALVDNWRCSGTDGMCSPDGIAPEVAVPGALCRDLAGGALANRCTFACGGASECLNPPTPGSTCGDGPLNEGPPDWCGG